MVFLYTTTTYAACIYGSIFLYSLPAGEFFRIGPAYVIQRDTEMYIEATPNVYVDFVKEKDMKDSERSNILMECGINESY